MNIELIRKNIMEHMNKEYEFIYYGSRGQDEVFVGKIDRVYHRIFTVKTNNGITKSFSYSDFAIKNIKISHNNWKILIFLKYYYKISL